MADPERPDDDDVEGIDQIEEIEPRDPVFLREHRTALLARQGISRTDFEDAILGGAMRRDFVIATGYTSLAGVLALWVSWLGWVEHHFGIAMGLVALVALFVFLLWRNYFASRRAALRARAYEGVLEKKVRVDDEGFATCDAVFDGGRVTVPRRVFEELVPGVRYRVHGAGSDEIAVDVVVDDDEVDAKRLGAYR